MSLADGNRTKRIGFNRRKSTKTIDNGAWSCRCGPGRLSTHTALIQAMILAGEASPRAHVLLNCWYRQRRRVFLVLRLFLVFAVTRAHGLLDAVVASAVRVC